MAICAGDCLLKRLDISINNLSTVNQSLLTSAVNMLEELNLSATLLAVQQIEIMNAICARDGLVTRLDISNNNLSTVNHSPLTSAVNMLEKG